MIPGADARLGWGSMTWTPEPMKIRASPPSGSRSLAGLVRDQPCHGSAAVFLDRDGTLIEHVHYLSDPALVRLLPGAAEALKRLRHAGFARVLVTNQSAIGRGMLTEERLDQIHDRDEPAARRPGRDDRRDLLLPGRSRPATIGPWWKTRTASRDPACCSARPPICNWTSGASWMVGDLISDVLAGLNAGCRSIWSSRARPQPRRRKHSPARP